MISTPTLLLVDDCPPDQNLCQRYLLADTNRIYRLLEAKTAATGLEVCRTQPIDVVIVDSELPDADGLQFLQALHTQHNSNAPPVIMVADVGDERIAVQAIKLGAEDYLVKQRLTPELLQATVYSAMESAQLRLQLRQSENRYRAIVEDQTELICRYLPNCTLTFVNSAYCRYFGSTSEQLLGQNFLDWLPPSESATVLQQIAAMKEATPENAVFTHEHAVLNSRGEVAWQQWTNRAIFDDNHQLVEIQAVGRDISDRKHLELQLSQQVIDLQQHQRLQQQAEAAIQQLNRELSDRVTELQTLIDTAPVGIAIASDSSCSQMQYNAHLRQLLGVSPGYNISKSAPPEEQPGFRVFQDGREIPPEDLPMQLAARLGVDVQDREIEVVWSNGTSRHLLSYATPLRDQKNEVRGVIGAFLDITERKQAEADLQQREATIQKQLAQIEAIYATAPVGLCFVDRDWRYVQVNDRLAQINGLPVADHLGRSVRELFPALVEAQEPIFEKILQTGTPVLDIEIQGTTPAQPDVQRDWLVSYYPFVAASGEILGINVMVQEVTERKRIEATLRENEQRLMAIIDNSRAAIFLKDVEGRYLLMNHECKQLCRVTDEAIAGKTDHDLFPKDIADAVRSNDLQVIETRESVTLEEEIPLEDGVHTFVAVKFPLLNSEGIPYAICGISTDISDRARLQAERDQLLRDAEAARHEAEAANRSKDDFVSLVAHELRSPLNAIMGWAKLLQTRQFDEATKAKALDTIIRNAQTQVQLIEDLLDIARMERGTLRLTMAPVNLEAMVRATVETISLTAEAKQIRLETHMQTLQPIPGDFQRLQQVVLNLLTNAIKFTPEGGCIEVRLEEVREGEMTGAQEGEMTGARDDGRLPSPTHPPFDPLRAAPIHPVTELVEVSPLRPAQGSAHSLPHAHITIRDTGKGIPPDILPHIFDRFQQDQQTSTAKQGLGLGLAIAKYITEQHGGTITAHSEGEGQGATFTILLPRFTNV